MAFSYKRTITIDHTKVPGDLTGFPVLVSLTHDDLRTVANGGHVTSSSGYDIRFYSDSNLTSALPHEIEKYVASTGQIIMWVKSDIDTDADTVFYMGYGDSGITTSQEDKANAWDSDFVAVWHMKEGTGTSVEDSAGSLTGSFIENPEWDTGKINGALRFFDNTHADQVSFTSTSLGTAHTVSFWVKYDAGGGVTGRAICGASGHCAGWFESGNNYYSAGSGNYAEFNTHGITAGAWTHLAYRRSGTSVYAYKNGSGYADNPETLGSNTALTLSRISGFEGGTGITYATFGEVRLSSVARSENWVTTEYNNQNSPATFHTLGSETSHTPSTTFVPRIILIS